MDHGGQQNYICLTAGRVGEQSLGPVFTVSPLSLFTFPLFFLQALESVQRIKCRCHGVSSTCALKTCFMSSPNLHTTAQTLARKYRQAKEANVVRGSADRRPLLHLAKAIKQGKPLNFTEYQLHFTDSSPNFCKPDLIDGLPGSKGRPCSIRPGSHNSCAQRCCGEEPAVREERFRRCCRYKLTIGGGSIGRKCVRPCITVVRHYSCR